MTDIKKLNAGERNNILADTALALHNTTREKGDETMREIAQPRQDFHAIYGVVV